MALRYLLDENLRGSLLRAIQRHNATSRRPIEFTYVGEPDDLPLQSQDPHILRWAEREGYVLVTFDYSTMPPYLIDHMRVGGHLQGMFLVRRGCRIRDVIDWLALAADSGDDDQWRDQVIFIP
jgi:hypothetical protein